MKDSLYTFHGGLKLPPNKTLNPELKTLPVPPQLVVPVLQHKGRAATPIVAVGDAVLTGQMIAAAANTDDNFTPALPVHAPSSGRVVAIEPRAIPHITGLHADCIIIDTDGKDAWTQLTPFADLPAATPVALRTRIMEAGVTGLGGAGFPTYVKLRAGQVSTLIINGAECEPYISCDLQLMVSRATEILLGSVLLAQAAGGVETCLIVLEDNQPEAFAAMQSALETLDDALLAGSGLTKTTLRLVQVPAIYPVGGERQLIRVLTGLEIPHKFVPVEKGILVQNVGTAAAAYSAIIHGKPMISRVVTVAGDAVQTPQNLDVRLGTPIQTLLDACGQTDSAQQQVLVGGPMMGFPLADNMSPITKTVNCLLTSSQPAPVSKSMPCIRCGDCERVCPANLLPQQLYRYAANKDLSNAEKYHLFDCIECGCCNYVCPSRIPLVDFYRQAKAEIRASGQSRAKAEIARQRYEFRQQRLADEAAAQAKRQAEKKAALKNDKTDKQALIKAALARAKAKKDQ